MKKFIYIFAVLVFFIFVQNSFSQASRFRLDNGIMFYTEDAYTSGADASEFEVGLLNFSYNGNGFFNFSKGEFKDGWSSSLESKIGLAFLVFTDKKFSIPTFLPVEGTLKYNFNEETENIPAMSLSAGINYILQANSDVNGNNGIIKYIATKNYGRLGMNLNVNYITRFENHRFGIKNFQFGYSGSYMQTESLMFMGEVFRFNKDAYQISGGIRKLLPNAMVLSAGLGAGIGTRRSSDINLMFSVTWLNGL